MSTWNKIRNPRYPQMIGRMNSSVKATTEYVGIDAITCAELDYAALCMSESVQQDRGPLLIRLVEVFDQHKLASRFIKLSIKNPSSVRGYPQPTQLFPIKWSFQTQDGLDAISCKS